MTLRIGGTALYRDLVTPPSPPPVSFVLLLSYIEPRIASMVAAQLLRAIALGSEQQQPPSVPSWKQIGAPRNSIS